MKRSSFFEKMQAIKAKHDLGLALFSSSIIDAKKEVEGCKKVVKQFGVKLVFREWEYEASKAPGASTLSAIFDV